MVLYMATCKVQLRLRRLEQPLDQVFDAPQYTVDDQYEPIVEVRALPRVNKQELTTAKMSGDSPVTKAHLAITLSEVRRHGWSGGPGNPLGIARLKHARVVGIERAGFVEAVDYLVSDVEASGHLQGGPQFLKLLLTKFGDLHGAS